MDSLAYKGAKVEERPIIYSERLLFWSLEYWVAWPLTLTLGHKNRFVRLAGIPLFMLWILPAGIPWMFFVVPNLFAVLIESLWKERLS